jgi:hypothetical protein
VTTRDTLWLNTEAATDGTYIATLEIGDDHSVPLDRDAAAAMARGAATASQYAQYDAAVSRQITGRPGMTRDHASVAIAALRADRAPLDPADTAPLVLTPGVSLSTGEAFVAIHVDGRQIGQFTPDSAAQYARHCLEIVTGADLDGAYHRWLRTCGMDDDAARAVVMDLADCRTPRTGP